MLAPQFPPAQPGMDMIPLPAPPELGLQRQRGVGTPRVRPPGPGCRQVQGGGTGRCSELLSQQFPALQKHQLNLFAIINISLRYFSAGVNPRMTPEQALA